MLTRLDASTARRSLSSLTEKKTANIAVIGAGWWSQGWYLPHLSRNEGVKIVLVDQNPHPQSNLNPDLESLSSLSKRYNAPLFHSIKELLADPTFGPTLDGALVATPHATHYELGEILMQEGIRRKQCTKAKTYRPINILMEKPMTTNVHEGKKMHDLVEKYQEEGGKGCFLINHSANYRLQARTTERIIKAGKIGKVRHISAFLASPLSWIFDDPSNKGWNEPTTDMLGNGFCWGQCSHLLAWIFHTCPDLKPNNVFCAMNHSPMTGADISHAATITLSDSSGNNDVILSMSGTSLLPGNAHSDPAIGKQVRIKIFGSKGAIVYGGDDRDPSSGQLELRRVDNGGQVELPGAHGAGFDFENLAQKGAGPESLQNFIDACFGRTNYYVGADSCVGLKTVQTLEAMYRSNTSRQMEEVMYKEH